MRTLLALSLVVCAPQAYAATITVPAGGDLQHAIDSAVGGDTILLQAGATFAGNFVLPVHAGSGFVTIKSSAASSALPADGMRVTPSFASALARIQSPNSMAALATQAGAHHYQLQFLEFGANVGGYGDIVQLGDGSSAQNTGAAVPHDLVVDRCYVHGDPVVGQKRGIALNSASTAIVNSYIADIKAVGQDSQAIGGWNGPGPFTIANNYLEAAGENFLLGGADPSIANLVPSDVTFRGNYLSKPLAWRDQSWSVKNLVELKNAQRVVIDANTFENNWAAEQEGYAVLFTPRNQDGTAPWSVVQHVRFTNNVVRHVSSAINILGTDDMNPSQPTNDIVVRNNLFDDVSAAEYGGPGSLLLIDGASAVVFDHNTAIVDGASPVFAYGATSSGFVFTNNIMPVNLYGIMGDNASPGNATVAAFFPGSTVRGNALVGGSAGSYPSGNYFPLSLGAVGFVDPSARDYHLMPGSAYRAAGTDGRDVGCNVDALLRPRAITGDLDGDGKTDILVRRPSTNVWYVLLSSSGFSSYRTYTWGAAGDIPVAGDFDGDGIADIALFRPSTATWYILTSNSNFQSVVAQQFGLGTDTPVAMDYDGDGKTDLAVYRASTSAWYIWQSSNGSVVTRAFGMAGDAPVPADYDGDGKADVAVFRPASGQWYVLRSSDGGVMVQRWGLATDIPIPGDFDGDGKADIAVRRPSTGEWYVLGSTSGARVYSWGLSTDVAVRGDYDGDGAEDIVVWRPSSGTWFMLLSSSRFTQDTSLVWGLAPDSAVLGRP